MYQNIYSAIFCGICRFFPLWISYYKYLCIGFCWEHFKFWFLWENFPNSACDSCMLSFLRHWQTDFLQVSGPFCIPINYLKVIQFFYFLTSIWYFSCSFSDNCVVSYLSFWCKFAFSSIYTIVDIFFMYLIAIFISFSMKCSFFQSFASFLIWLFLYCRLSKVPYTSPLSHKQFANIFCEFISVFFTLFCGPIYLSIYQNYSILE